MRQLLKLLLIHSVRLVVHTASSLDPGVDVVIVFQRPRQLTPDVSALLPSPGNLGDQQRIQPDSTIVRVHTEEDDSPAVDDAPPTQEVDDAKRKQAAFHSF